MQRCQRSQLFALRKQLEKMIDNLFPDHRVEHFSFFAHRNLGVDTLGVKPASPCLPITVCCMEQVSNGIIFTKRVK